MTSETRTVIDLRDVTGVELECQRCHAKMLYPLAKAPERMMAKCPNCMEPWFPIPDGPQFNAPLYEQLKDWISGMVNLAQNQAVLAKVRLEIKPPTT